MKAGAFGRAPERRQVQPGGRVLPGMFAPASTNSPPQSSSSAPASNKPAATPSAVLSRWGSGETSGSGRFSGSAGRNSSSRLAKAQDEGLSGRGSAREEKPQPKSLASSDSIARARQLGLNRRARTPSPEPEGSEDEYERSQSPPPARRQRAQSTSVSAFARTRPQSRAESVSPPRPQHRRRASSPPPVARTSRIPSPPPAREPISPAQATPEQPVQGFLGSLWGRASQLVSGATGATQENGVKELAPARKDSVTSDMPVPESHVTPFEAAARPAEEENRKPTRPLVVPPLVAAALAPHQAACAQPALLRSQSTPNPTVSPITYHRPTSLHAPDSQRSTNRFRSQPTPFDWLDPHGDLPLEPYMFLRTAAEKATRRGGAGRAARAPRPVSAMAADQAQPPNGYAAGAFAGGMAGAASAGSHTSSAGYGYRHLLLRLGLTLSCLSAAGLGAAPRSQSQPTFAPPPLVAPHFVSSPPPAFASTASTAPTVSPPAPAHLAPPPFGPSPAAPQSTSAPPAPQLYAPAIAAAMTAAPPAAMAAAPALAPPMPSPLVAPAWQPVSQFAQPALVEPRTPAKAAAESLPAYNTPAEAEGGLPGAAQASANAERAAASGTSVEDVEPIERVLPRSGAGPDTLPTFPASVSTTAPPFSYPVPPSTFAVPTSSPGYTPTTPPSSSPHPPQSVPQSTVAPSKLPPLVPPASLPGSAAPAAASMPPPATMPVVYAAPAPPAAAGAPPGAVPRGGPALPSLPSLSRLLPATVGPTQPTASSKFSTSKAAPDSSSAAASTIAAASTLSGDLPPMPEPRSIPQTSPPPVPPLVPSSSFARSVQQPTATSLGTPRPPTAMPFAVPLLDVQRGQPGLLPIVPPLLPPPVPPKPPGYAAREGATTPIPSSGATPSQASLPVGQGGPFEAVASTTSSGSGPAAEPLTAALLASDTPLPPSPAPPSCATLPAPSLPPVLADTKKLFTPGSTASRPGEVIDNAAFQSAHAQATLQAASIVVEPPTPVMPRNSLFTQEPEPAVEQASTKAEQGIEEDMGAAIEGLKPSPVLQPLDLGWSLPDLGSLALSPVTTTASWGVEADALAQGSTVSANEKNVEPLPLPQVVGLAEGDDAGDEPDPLDEAFDAVTAFASSFAQADLARAAQDPNHTERTERWLQRQGIEMRPLSVVQAAAPADEATSRSLAPGIYRPQTAPPATVPLGFSALTAGPLPSIPSTYSSWTAHARDVSLSTSLARLAVVSEGDSSSGLSVEPPSPLETSIGAVAVGQLDRPRAVNGGGTETGEGFWVQRKVERHVGKARSERVEAKTPPLGSVGDTEGANRTQTEVKSEAEELAGVAALFAGW
ncbi:plus agglutinin [Rhodotorula toruloides]|uniref:Plus agglutinin n=1 Tax=Rhodotorula toruloides TaxID=5286 RepID=A0A511KNI9_RHOTO|nr:plus agglutinin [Rhodotorula toruloides]